MFYTIMLVLLVIDSVLLVLAILMQSGQGGGMAASFGGVSSSASNFLGARQTGNLLTKMSWWCGGLFLGLAYVLSLASSRTRAPKSVLDQAFPNAPITQTAPAATLPLNPAPTGAAPATTAPATKTPSAPPTAPAKKP
jgi:preprotein translocase subunit SecG